jgi:hypothetical protein
MPAPARRCPVLLRSSLIIMVLFVFACEDSVHRGAQELGSAKDGMRDKSSLRDSLVRDSAIGDFLVRDSLVHDSLGPSLNCGNGQVDEGESCDGPDLSSTTCATLGYKGGQLACAKNCTFDTALCTGPQNITTYFKCSFSQPQTNYGYQQAFPDGEPCGYQCEKGIWGWAVTSLYGGHMYLVHDPEDASRAAIKFIYDVPNFTDANVPEKGVKAVKFYELQGRTPSQKGTKPNYDVEPYLSTKEAYYHFKVLFPASTTVGSNWRMVFQVCGLESDYVTHPPQLSMAFEGDDLNVIMYGAYWTDNKAHRWLLSKLQALPKDEWIDVVVYYKQGTGWQVQNGTVTIWMDGVKKFDSHALPTGTSTGEPFVIWGIALYSSIGLPAGEYQMYKDVVVASSRLEKW